MPSSLFKRDGRGGLEKIISGSSWRSHKVFQEISAHIPRIHATCFQESPQCISEGPRNMFSVVLSLHCFSQRVQRR